MSTRIIILAVAAAFSMQAGAQKEEIPSWEISLGVGVMTNNIDWEEDDDIYSLGPAGYLGSDYTPLENYRLSSTYEGKETHTATFSLSAYRDISDDANFALGLVGAWESREGSLKSRMTRREAYKYYERYLTLMPSLRIYYIRHEGFRMYSGASGGVAFRWEKDDMNGLEDSGAKFAWHLTGFGISVGKKACFATEVGYGALGIFRASVGYRF